MTKEGTILDGKYEIWKEVGRGGMSIVYLARDNRLNKQWAVKEIKNDGSKSTATLLKGLEREANILKNVDHPVLPRIVDIINQEGTIYVVMDFVEGTTIGERIKKEGAQPQELVIEWGLQLASALDYLHNMNPPIIYRDMKPSNVMIKPEGGVKLIDFGTAKEYDVENNADTTALGTRGYAAPEQFGDANGRGIYNTDARTDIYNLGATLYHIVTGMNPCDPPYEIKPIREWNPALSSGLEKILLKCTQADPNDRYQNCKELMYALEHYNELDDAHKKKNKLKIAAFTAALVLGGAATAVSAYGNKKLNEIKLEDYNSCIEKGNEYRFDGNYEGAAEEYKNAFEIDGSDAEAYDKYIQVYVEASNIINADGTTVLDLEDGLNVIANRIREGYDDVDSNDEVLYKLAIAYFDEVGDYKKAAKYFEMVDKDDKDFGELAKYYYTISMLLSNSSASNSEEIIEEVDRFAEYNQKQYNNQNATKFINYKTIGKIYATNIVVNGVAEKAEKVMSQAVSDLEEYNGTDLDSNEYFFAYYDYLTYIYSNLAENAEDEVLKEQYYKNVIDYCDEYFTILEIKNDSNDEIDIGGDNDNEYNTAYFNKMKMKAAVYEVLGDFDMAISTYKEAEQRLGKDNVHSKKIYAEHIDYMYSYYENQIKDPTRWAKELPSELNEILKVFEESKGVRDISSEKTWKKRSDTLQKLLDGDYDTGDEEETDAGTEAETEDTEGAAQSSDN